MTNGRTNGRTDGKWKIEQCSVGPETAILRFSFFSVSKFLVLFTIHNSEARRAVYMELQNIILNMETDKVNPQTNEDIENTSPSWLLQQ